MSTYEPAPSQGRAEKARESIFHKLVTKEDDYTQLLCNLMLRFDDFRAQVLSLFLEDRPLAYRIR